MSVRTQHVVAVGLALAMALGIVWLSTGVLRGTTNVEKLLDAELPLRSEGTTYTFTVDEPGPVTLVIDMPAKCRHDGVASISPLYLALRPDPIYEPDREPEHKLTVPMTGLPSTRLELNKVGPYVLRMDPIPMAMGSGEAPPSKARVRILRARD